MFIRPGPNTRIVARSIHCMVIGAIPVSGEDEVFKIGEEVYFTGQFSVKGREGFFLLQQTVHSWQHRWETARCLEIIVHENGWWEVEWNGECVMPCPPNLPR